MRGGHPTDAEPGWNEVEWAVATRFQGHKGLVVIENARGSSLDPSADETTTKVGIDATIAEGIPRERYERISYAYAERAKIADYLAGKRDPAQPAAPGAAAELAREIHALLESTPVYYTELAEKFATTIDQSLPWEKRGVTEW